MNAAVIGQLANNSRSVRTVITGLRDHGVGNVLAEPAGAPAATDRYAKKDMLSVAPKAAVEAITRGIASEEGRFGVGVVDSGLWHQRLGTAEDIPHATRFSPSPRADWISGQLINVDGGYAL
ncbi:hypothetical protein BAY59_34715 [Prauserella coralliicola]|nr:hypothetical protein BAY59_34715 [Prauserella coralliicola]